MPFKVGDKVMLERSRYRGRFRSCKGRIGVVSKVVRIKHHSFSHHTLRFYYVDKLHPRMNLVLLGEDLTLATEEEDFVVQETSDRLSG